MNVIAVAPHAGAWIETIVIRFGWFGVMSLPTRERGLKLSVMKTPRKNATVAPHAGAWIETSTRWLQPRSLTAVAPHAGAWIETFLMSFNAFIRRVAPHAGAWIETSGISLFLRSHCVAPHAGAWIETLLITWHRHY